MRSSSRSRIRTLTCLTLGSACFCLCSSCASKSGAPERRIENGVEVVVNGGHFYPVDGKPTTLTIKEEFRIDLEDPKFAEMGLSDAAKADLDSQGRVIIFRQYAGDGPLVFVFDEHGTFQKSFGRRGQGPGEIIDPFPIGVTGPGEIAIRESSAKILFFDLNGAFLRTTALSASVPIIGRAGLSLLANGSYLIQYPRLGESGEVQEIAVGIFDSGFRKIKDLATFSLPGSIEKISDPFVPVPVFCHSGSEIFLGFEKNGTDISVFDLGGNLKRIIRKSYPRIVIPASFRDDLLKRMPENHPLRRNLKLPANFPAFQFFFADERGRLYVATCEKDAATGQNICEIFASDGMSIQRAPLGYFDILKWMFEGQPGDVVIRNGRVLCVRDKENGYREVIVSSMIWH